jgi:putative transposase
LEKSNNNFKKRTRLKGFDYEGNYRYFITLCAYEKKPIFSDNSSVDWLIDILKNESEKFGFKVWVYCFMPDHLHLLIEGKENNSNLKKFISSFKQKTGFYYKQKTRDQLWQINFYEHILRKEENTINVANYILGNPVRKGLVNNFANYRFVGSFEYDIKQP